MKIQLIVGLLVVCFSARAQKTKNVTKSVNKYTKESYTVVKEKGKPAYKDGMYKRYTSYLTLEEGLYKQGIKVGKWVEVNIKSSTTTESFYKRGKVDSAYVSSPEGIVGKKYNIKGKLVSTYWYTGKRKVIKTKTPDGILYSALENHGYVLNEKVVTGLIVDDKKEGEWIFKNADGTKAVINFAKGKMKGKQTSYHSNGNVSKQMFYNDSFQLDGNLVVYYANGDTLKSINYAGGKPVGRSVAKYRSGQVFYEALYDEGRLSNYIEYNLSGKVNSKSQVIKGAGEVFEYYFHKDKLSVSQKSPVADGLLNGDVIYFSADTVSSIQEYKNGNFVRFKKKKIESKKPKKIEREYLVPSTAILDTIQMIKAAYSSGEIGLQRHLAQNIRYPIPAMENDVQGKIFVSFVIDRLGNVTDVKTLGDEIGFGLEEESMRVIRTTSGQWRNACQYGFPVKMRFKIPLKYQATTTT